MNTSNIEGRVVIITDPSSLRKGTKTMKHFAKIVATIAAIIAVVATPALAQSESDPAQLLEGNWRMTSLEQGAPGGKLAEVDFTGQIIFTDPGIVAVQAMNPSGESSHNPYSVAGYEAYYGQYTVNEGNNTVVFDVEASVVRDLMGQELERAFEVTEDQLVLTPTSPDENWRVTYERY